MAYVDFSETAAMLDRPAPQLAQLLTEHASVFSPIERNVLALSHRDGLETLRPRARRSWLGRLLLGPDVPSPTLANQRLEALRRLAVETRHHGWRVRDSAIAAAKAAGFTDAQISWVIDTIGRATTISQRNFA